MYMRAAADVLATSQRLRSSGQPALAGVLPSHPGPLPLEQLAQTPHHPGAEAAALVGGQDVHVGEVGEVCKGDAVGDEAGKADHLAGGGRRATDLCNAVHAETNETNTVVDHSNELGPGERLGPLEQVRGYGVVEGIELDEGRVGRAEKVLRLP